MGLRWAFRERLSSQSFYYLSDLVLAAKGIEQQMEREKTKKGRPQTLQHTTIEDVRYPVISATQKYSSIVCNPKENASTLSSKVSSDQREYGHNIASKRMVVDFVNVIKNEDGSNRQEIDRCTVKFPIVGIYYDGVFSDVVNTTTCDLPSKRWKADQDGYLFGNTPQAK